VARLPLEDVRLCAPVLRPPKFLAIGLNYADHVAESGLETPKVPTVFNKQSTCVAGPRDPVHLPRVSSKIDYEGELGFVIGRRCRHVPRARAHEVIAGYLVVNDVSVRDWQFRVQTWTMGKSFDTHGPIGPWITTADEVGDPNGLRLRTWVNGELRQDSNTKQLIFDCSALVEHLSTAFTLEPGDVIATGTPAGVGAVMKPPKYLQIGDVVRIEIDGLGALENTVVAEPVLAQI
jgi:2-keto-4-pentenoate hydratase/2-oxohepta-3-ene-1,7-dioic acid hydratase in catechol pathway